ncbi:hypothetical protein AKO1_008785 [Acrasis kona]|uniref:RNA helicase n=1 Tax=Acrasis kona TaxID=1008807 RepID=A0AAW2ZHP3_9EUKA
MSKKDNKSKKKEQQDVVQKKEENEDVVLGDFTDANEEQLNDKELRQKYKIYINKGTEPPKPFTAFDQLQSEPHNFRDYLINNIPYRDTPPTPVQMQAIPAMLQKRDTLVAAETGSGKTAAYTLPALALLHEPRKEGFRCIVIAPTRVLAEQIHRQFMLFSKGKDWRIRDIASGSVSKDALASKRNDVLIATPMKLISVVADLPLSHLQMVIFDEADRLFDMGFAEQVDNLLASIQERAAQNFTKHLFSATIPLSVEQLADSILNVRPLHISIGVKNAGASTIDQKLLFAGDESGKIIALKERIAQGLKPPVLIFVQSIERAKQLYQELLLDKSYKVDYIHGKRSDVATKTSLRDFRLGKTWALICTDVMARGLDFLGVSCVINYDFPVSMISYVHRIGRTGRAGKRGEAVTFFTHEDLPLLRNIAEVMNKTGCDVPEWIFKRIKKVSNKTLSDTAVHNAMKASQLQKQQGTKRKYKGGADKKNKKIKK